MRARVTTGQVIENVVKAVAEVNHAFNLSFGRSEWDSAAENDVRIERAAVDVFCDAIEQAVNHEPLWKYLSLQEMNTRQAAPIDTAKVLLEHVSSVFTASYVALLSRCGYRSPPPPMVDDLVNDVREAVLLPHGRPKWGDYHLQDVKSKLLMFVSEVRAHLRGSGGLGLKAILERCRKLGVAGLLLLVLSNTEVKTGPQLSIELGSSLRQPFKVEITVPLHARSLLPWEELVGCVVESQAWRLRTVLDEFMLYEEWTIEFYHRELDEGPVIINLDEPLDEIENEEVSPKSDLQEPGKGDLF